MYAPPKYVAWAPLSVLQVHRVMASNGESAVVVSDTVCIRPSHAWPMTKLQLDAQQARCAEDGFVQAGAQPQLHYRRPDMTAVGDAAAAFHAVYMCQDVIRYNMQTSRDCVRIDLHSCWHFEPWCCCRLSAGSSGVHLHALFSGCGPHAAQAAVAASIHLQGSLAHLLDDHGSLVSS